MPDVHKNPPFKYKMKKADAPAAAEVISSIAFPAMPRENFIPLLGL